MPSFKALALLAVATATVAAATVATPAAAQRFTSKTHDLCLLNKAWVIWKGQLQIHRMVPAGSMLENRRDTHSFNLLLNQHVCVKVESYGAYNVNVRWDPIGFGGAMETFSPVASKTMRLDGSAFGVTTTLLDGVVLQ